MKRISTATKAADLFGVGKHGWRDGDLPLGVMPTDGEAIWFNNLQEEVASVIEANGITLDGNVRTQLYQAIQLMIAGAINNGLKTPVRFATIGNIVLSGLGTQAGGDWGVALTAGDRILPKDQATGSQNGIYIAAAGAWARATDADGVGELPPGALVVVQEGVALADSVWELSTDGPITIGTTALVFTRQGASASNGFASVGATVAANALTVTIGAETLSFRSTSLTSGAPVPRTAGSTGSLTVPTGGTLGLANGVQGQLAWGWIDNAGALEPFIINANGGQSSNESRLINTVAISSGATSANVFYSATARTGVAFRVRGFCDISEAIAGTYATGPTLVQPIGGQVQIGGASMVRVQGANGKGTVGTCIGRFSNILANQGVDISYVDSASAGAAFTINTSDLYTMSFVHSLSGAGDTGISLNSNQLSTNVSSIFAPDRLTSAAMFTGAAAGVPVSWSGWLNAGDVVRAHTDTSAVAAAAIEQFTIVKNSR